MAAAKKYRNELKYFISYGEYTAIKGRLMHFMHTDPYGDQNNQYLIRSLYFDDIHNSAYYEKLNGLEKRKKYRIRIYNQQSDLIKLERKSKEDQYTQKETERISREQCEKLLRGDILFLQEGTELQKDLFIQMKTLFLKPVVLVDYLREAYIHPVENVRITFDSRLKSGMFSRDLWNPRLPMADALEPGTMIMEVKFNRFLPSILQRLVSDVRCDRDSISKYVLCRNFCK